MERRYEKTIYRRTVICILKAHEGGRSTRELCREAAGISRQTFYRWKSKFDGMEVNEAKRVRIVRWVISPQPSMQHLWGKLKKDYFLNGPIFERSPLKDER